MPASRPEPNGRKKTYKPPELVVYGDIREITRALNTRKGTSDGKGGGLLKTGLI